MLFVDESHVTVPQIGGMFRGDFDAQERRWREYGFRLPSCVDNRPLKFEEWDAMRGQTVFVSATPGPWELERTGGVFVEQVIRPTGLIDPVVHHAPGRKTGRRSAGRVPRAARPRASAFWSPMLTKRMAEDLTEYLHERASGCAISIPTSRRWSASKSSAICGLACSTCWSASICCARGWISPNARLVAILDADKEGFLRSRTSLIQTIGRAARNIDGRVHALRRHDDGLA